MRPNIYTGIARHAPYAGTCFTQADNIVASRHRPRHCQSKCYPIGLWASPPLTMYKPGKYKASTLHHLRKKYHSWNITEFEWDRTHSIEDDRWHFFFFNFFFFKWFLCNPKNDFFLFKNWKSRRHSKDFPSGLPPQYYPSLLQFSYRVRMGSDAFYRGWSLTFFDFF